MMSFKLKPLDILYGKLKIDSQLLITKEMSIRIGDTTHPYILKVKKLSYYRPRCKNKCQEELEVNVTFNIPFPHSIKEIKNLNFKLVNSPKFKLESFLLEECIKQLEFKLYYKLMFPKKEVN